MELCGSTLPSAGSLDDLDLIANNRLNLTSWLLEDDVVFQPSFGRGAKGMHSISSAVAGHASPFITSQDLPDWMETSFDIDWNQPFNLEECFNNNPKQQVQQLDISANELPTQFTPNLLIDPVPPQHLFAPQQYTEYQKVLFQKNETEDVAYSQDSPSPQQEFEESSTSLCALQESFTLGEEVPFQQSESPFIISVPLTDVFEEKKPPVFKTINITGIERINVTQKPTFCSTPINDATYVPSSERKEPQKIIINLRRVTLPATKSSAPNEEVRPSIEALAHSAPTLKEVLTRDDADDFLHEMVTMRTVTPALSLKSELQDYSAPHSTKDLEDNGFGGSYSSPSELLLFSPSSNSGHGSIHSPQSIDNLYSCNEDSEDELSQDSAAGAIRSSSASSDDGCEESVRYAPYKSLEKKLRKKEQNKRAALRYRQKKKEEEEVVLGILQQEEDKQKKLTEKYNALQMELNLMKKLMKEMCSVKVQLK